MVELGLTSLEALGVAVRRELDAAATYEALAEVCPNPLARDRFRLLEREAEQHEALLRRRYQELFPDVVLAVPPPGRTSRRSGSPRAIAVRV